VLVEAGRVERCLGEVVCLAVKVIYSYV